MDTQTDGYESLIIFIAVNRVNLLSTRRGFQLHHHQSQPEYHVDFHH